MNLKQILALVILFLFGKEYSAAATNSELDECGHDLGRPTGLDSFFDVRFVGMMIQSLIPFQKVDLSMKFYLYKRDFPTCGHEIRIDDDSLQKSGFNPTHPTRIIIHGWMSQSKAKLNRDVRDAYLKVGDYNVVVVDWSIISYILNYFKVVSFIEQLGKILGDFAIHLHNSLGVDYDNIYIIAHSLGSHIAGVAGKRIHPAKFNTIFALDPAGPGFYKTGLGNRIDSTDAKYVESIQTSINFGFIFPIGHASFFPNKGIFQKCLTLSCSHSRAYELFAESITTDKGFWGTICGNVTRELLCFEKGTEYRMGGEPSQPKNGIFYVKTKASSPFAMGRSDL